jgi:imidazolonepropionase-like amidohydrolase
MRTKLLAFLLACSAPTARAETLVLKAGRLIDGRGGQPIVPAMVRLEGDRIVEGGERLAIPPGARVLDLGAATLLPGFIDLHTHLTDKEGRPLGGGPTQDHTVTGGTLGRAQRPHHAGGGLHHLPRHVTHLALRRRGPARCHRAGAIPGPRMLVAGNDISPTGGAGDARQFSIFVDVPTVQNLAEGPDEIVKAVRTNFKHGADHIKMLVTGAMLSKGIPPEQQSYADEEIKAAVTEAKRWSRTVAAHARGTEGIKAAIRAGVRTIDHGSMLDAEAIAMLKKAPTYYVPTLYISQVVPDNPKVPEYERERGRRLRGRHLQSFEDAWPPASPSAAPPTFP